MAHSTPELIVPLSASEAVALVGGWILTCLDRHATSGRRFRLVLTGGTTPVPLYEFLASHHEARWDLVDWFWSDERAVAPDDDDSNYRLVRKHLLDRVRHDSAHVHRMRGELRPIEYAAAVSAEELTAAIGDEPFDFTLLGMGPDGHIASLFPGHDEVHVVDRSVVPVRASPKPPAERLSLTLPRINHSETIVVLTSGPQKLAVARQIVTDRGAAHRLPAARLDPARTRFVCTA